MVNNKKIVIFILSLLPANLFSDPTYFYVVWRASVPSISAYTSLGYTNNSQPIQNTMNQVLFYGNTNFSLLTVTPKTQTEKNILDSAVSLGYMKLIMTNEVRKHFDGKAGEDITELWVSTRSELPSEFYQVWKSS